MAHQIILLIAQYGVLLVFINVLVAQLGAPLPAFPTLMVAGALVAGGQLSIVHVMFAALVACLLSDLLWYWAGRHFGAGVMRTLCRVSLSPDSCVRQSELRFNRWRGQILLVAKFVPGLSTVTPPLVGAMGLGLGSFIVFDGVGALLWSGLGVGLGFAFAAQIEGLLLLLASAGTFAFELLLSTLALYVLAKWWQRHRLLVVLRMARITVLELNAAMLEGRAVAVIDVRSDAARQLDDRIIPGALLVNESGIDRTVNDIPSDRELVVYCNCPNEVTAARIAKVLLAQGYVRVRPLLGGLDAWDAAGYPVERLHATSAAGPANAIG